MVADLKQLIENAMIKNIDTDNFGDNIEAARVFNCHNLKEALYLYGRKHLKELY